MVLSPGAKYTVTHDVSALYDFEGAGVGTFNFEPVTNFQVFLGDATTANSTKTPADVVGVSAAAIDVEITKDVAKRELKPSNKRAIAMCTNSARRQFMKDRLVCAPFLAIHSALMLYAQLHRCKGARRPCRKLHCVVRSRASLQVILQDLLHREDQQGFQPRQERGWPSHAKLL